MKCQVNTYLAYAMLIYTCACVYYMIRTRSVGTPFNDSLTEEQREIKKASANVRRNMFMQGIAASVVLISVTRPFKQC